MLISVIISFYLLTAYYSTSHFVQAYVKFVRHNIKLLAIHTFAILDLERQILPPPRPLHLHLQPNTFLQKRQWDTNRPVQSQGSRTLRFCMKWFASCSHLRSSCVSLNRVTIGQLFQGLKKDHT
jgi:hypothetical protein